MADLHRCVQLCQRSSERYLDTLAAVEETSPCSHLFDAVSHPIRDAGRRFRALRLDVPDDLALLQTVSRGEFLTAAFRNRDVRHVLYSKSALASIADQRHLSAKVGRKLRLSPARGLIKKVPHTRCHLLTARGHLLTAAVRAARDASISKLLRDATQAPILRAARQPSEVVDRGAGS